MAETLTRKYPDLLGDLAIIQGESYRQLQGGKITLHGNWLDADLRGHLRTNFLNEGGEILAIFEFDPSTYDEVTDTTTLKPWIRHQYTQTIPKTQWKEGRLINTTNLYVYDIEAEKNDEVGKLAPGYAQVIGEVTDNSQIYDPPVIWDGGIDDVELTSTVGLTKTYTIWGDAAKTINLGAFVVTDGVGIVSKSYDDLTGVLTLGFSNGSTFSTEDIRGEQGIQGIQGIQGEKGDTGDQGIQGIPGNDATALETLTVHLSDNVTPVAPATAVEYYFLRFNFTVTGVWFETPFQAPSGSSAIARVLYNADGNTAGTFTNIFTSADALTIPAGSTSVGLLVPNTTFLASGGVLRFDIVQVGATNTGLGYRVTLQGTRS
jgi:hypothetical protein